MKRENPAGTKIARDFHKARNSPSYGNGLRKMFTQATLARMANKRKRKSA